MSCRARVSPWRKTIWSLPTICDWPDQPTSPNLVEKAILGVEPNHTYQLQTPIRATITAPTAAATPTVLRHNRASTTDRWPSYTGTSMPCELALALQRGEQT